ncbi:MAG: nucleotidyltransferase family protein [Gaiellaceae bacterium]
MTRELDGLLIGGDATVREAMECIDRNLVGIALVVETDRRLLGTVTDGDIRRAMLADLSLETPVTALVERQRALAEPRPIPLTAPLDAQPAELVALMQRYDLRQIPLVDDQARVRAVALLHDLIEIEGPPLRAVVMAGGFGTRLGALTDATPKPMLPVGDRPLLERIICQLRDAGIEHVNVTTHYHGEAIAEHFGDGSKYGVEIEYVPEERPLGTAGALGFVNSDGPTLVMNGDILTGVDFRAMHHFHDEHEADMTVAVRPYEVRVPYGLVDLAQWRITGVSEKPLVRGFVNAGMYLINPDVCALVAAGEPLDMPQLIERLVSDQRNVVGFPLREYWLDIGQLADYEQALVDVEGL